MMDVEPKWMQLARGELGVREVKGPSANPKIVEYHRATMLRSTSDEVSWCSAFVNWCMIQAGENGTRSAVARSWINYGVEIKEPRVGCVVVMARGKEPWMGHVGFYVGEEKPGYIQLIGGNQGDSVSISEFPKSKILSYRWPGERKKKK